ncbi:hypothetical protein BD626DRAFT_439767 [Schizophyllum amplum]|uniref:MYND-type domain-containing protein n=1 Tax=Schizophyllum amplum TaxID=97359 RepID=A0A550BXR8_9AGAR|nr:hypothetical protein BD626DRAFT_439767 [Auriculariopsis ampla]
MHALLKDHSNLAFHALRSDPPPGPLENQQELVIVIVAGLDVFSSITNLSKTSPLCRGLQSPMRALWPHILKWAALLRPVQTRNVWRHRSLAGCGIISSILESYYMLMCDTTYAKPFLHINNTIVEHAFELWKLYPRYTTSPNSETLATANTSIWIVRILHRMLVQHGGGATAEDRALFIDKLAHVVGSKRALYDTIARQTDFLAEMGLQRTLHDAISTVWTDHYDLLITLVGIPRFARSKVPATTIASVVSAATKCLKRRETRYGAFPAVKLLNALCSMVKSNRSLVHAVDAGVFDLVRSLSEERESIEDPSISDFIRLLCAGLYHAQVIRAFVRRHRDSIPLSRTSKALGRATWRDVARLASEAGAMYASTLKGKAWQCQFDCSNTMGPHNRRVQICPCANAFYCSGSCQRMRRFTHLDSCCSDESPWGLHGIISLADALFICIAVWAYIDRNAAIIGRELSSLRLNQSSLRLNQSSPRIKQRRKCAQLVKQAVVRVDITDVLPDARHEVDTRTVYMPDAPPAGSIPVAVEVVLRAGKTSATRFLPFTYPRDYFKH